MRARRRRGLSLSARRGWHRVRVLSAAVAMLGLLEVVGTYWSPAPNDVAGGRLGAATGWGEEVVTMALWPLAIVAVVGILLGVLLLIGPRLFRGTRGVQVRGLWCPVRHEPVDVEFQIAAWGGERVDVTRCSAFTPPEAITCERDCLGRRPASALAAGPPVHRDHGASAR